MRVLLISFLTIFAAACGSGAGSGGVGAPVGVLSIAPPGNPSTVNSNPPTIFVNTDCSSNTAALGTWSNPSDSGDKLIITADCKVTATKTGLVFSLSLDALTLTTSSWDAWVYNFGQDDPSYYSMGGVYTTPVRHVAYHFTSPGHSYIQWSGNPTQPIYEK